jgi:hypothetical protein
MTFASIRTPKIWAFLAYFIPVISLRHYTMATNLSRENRKKKFEQQPFDAALKPTFLFSPLLMQSRDGTSGVASFKRRQDAFLNMFWVDLVGDMIEASTPFSQTS